MKNTTRFAMAAAFLLASCASTPQQVVSSSSADTTTQQGDTSMVSSSPSTPSSSISSSSTQSITSEPEEGTIQVKAGSILRRYAAGETVPLLLREEANYVLIDGQGSVLYTASRIEKGYGGPATSYIKEGVTLDLSGESMVVPQGTTLYCLSDQGYQKFVNHVGNSTTLGQKVMKAGSKECQSWNSSSNTYLSDKTVVFENEKEGVINPFAIRLGSIYDILPEGTGIYKMSAPYEDVYHFASDELTSITVYDETMSTEIAAGRNTLSVALNKRDVVYVKVSGPSESFFTMTVTLEDHLIELPYEVIENKPLDQYDVEGNPDVDPLSPHDLKVKKRHDARSVYINCNNPEKLSSACMNTSLCNTDVTEKDVFFTFEHNNSVSNSFYYGYRVTNKSDHDIYILVKNLGLQTGGAGTWLGEDEWIKFYNLTFHTEYDSLTESQKKNFAAYLGFSLEYQSENRQPISYRIPKGGYMYVMGGTSKDSYGNISVFNSADQKVISGRDGCSNGAVLFSVRGGEALGQFVTYRDSDARNLNKSDYITKEKQFGYTTQDGTGAQYAGWDDCHGVVDTQAEWVFNDSTPAGALKVNYENRFYTSDQTGEPFTEIENFQTRSCNNANMWVTHINPNNTAAAVGTDMTRYITTDHETDNPVILDYLHYDGRGSVVNIGNWMVDYQDTITLVNQGENSRTVAYRLRHNGTICTYLLDENGRLVKNYVPSYNIIIAPSSYGDGIDQPCVINITVAPHSVVRFTLGYNLLANSNGYITHAASLK